MPYYDMSPKKVKKKGKKKKKYTMTYGQNYGDGMYGGPKDKHGNPKGSN